MNAINTSIKMSDEILLVQNGFVPVPGLNPYGDALRNDLRLQSLGTIVSNLAYYGFVPSRAATEALMKLSDAGIYEFWKNAQPALAYVTGEDRNMGDFVVYKNFPKEVLEMSEARYWFNQVLMYWGLPNDWFTEEPTERAPLSEKTGLKVLDIAGPSTAHDIYVRLCKTNAKWTDFQNAQAKHLIAARPDFAIDIDQFSFKENGVTLVAYCIADVVAGTRKAAVSTATDVLRLASALSDGDVSLRTKTKFRKFSRPERRFLLGLIENAKHIEADFAMRKEPWKRLLSNLHPADFKVERVSAAYNSLYNKEVHTLDAKVEKGLAGNDVASLDLLKAQPGQLLRRLHKVYDLFGRQAFEVFKDVTHALTVSQLVKLDAYLSTVNDRKSLVFTPKGNWAKAQIVENGKAKIDPVDLADLRKHISEEVGARLNALHPEGFRVDPATTKVKLQSNGQELASYGRGTVFDIPENVKFIRTASYWEAKREFQNVWFDVGWNFYGEDWKEMGTVCWDSTALPFSRKAAVFSGDPTNSKDLAGRACQMIDLYPQKLVANGVRYAVWNVLCFSNIPFSDAKEVLATMQWGEEAEKGKLYEPSRAQVVFPLTGKAMSKYVAYVDLVERKLVYMDVGLRSNVRSATSNLKEVGEMMPAFVEYLGALPSVYDVFSHAGQGGLPVLYSDENVDVGGEAYVFQRRNADNSFDQVDLEGILNAKGDVVAEVKAVPAAASVPRI
ncbi:hypothetical protein OIU34_21080 [Pararhizobium sp. BT-229]|uniref:hypothetical protein n=1 Tax=Pararhizobium sp. BT-229 TaxID=2986923 RepID=UPI0021F78730|nr:hypothetical protein [Pararhizobium sp. BT-229]MCV9964385.1 hypothetical protein [Pararhizobium sp. BT-229]